jgi:tyrosinase
MSDEFNSINDPLFFLHHANLDYLWALWQSQDPKRLSEFSAPPGTRLDMGVYAPGRTAREVLDTQNTDGKGILCFKYEGLGVERYGV